MAATTSFWLASLHPPPKPRSSSSSAAATRRSSIILSAAPLLFLSTQNFVTKPSTAFEFRMTVPDQTLEEAESSIQGHAQSLRKVKELLMAESRREAQKQLRKSSALLKQDIYTIIQGKPPAERAGLRKLYAELFKGVSRLDYAARDKDSVTVWKCYDAVVASLDNILSKI